MTEKYNLIIPSSRKPYPDKYELAVGKIIADKFKSDVLFLESGSKAMLDIEVVSTKCRWEIKNIRGNSKYTIEDNLRKAEKQSSNVIITLLKPTKMSTAQAISKIKFYLSHHNTKLKRVILVTKSKNAIDIEV